MEYDKYYQTEHLFGAPYPELIAFYSKLEARGSLLDLGCGQGRDAIALARIGYEVTGIDNSKVGIQQLNEIAKREKLPLTGIEGDIYEFQNFAAFDHILLDSMFHFGKREQAKEIELMERIIKACKPNALITICIQQSKHKIDTLNSIIAKNTRVAKINEIELEYTFDDQQSNHSSTTTYEVITLKKKGTPLP